MVRNIAGVLMAIGRGEAPVTWATEVLAARDRTAGGVTAPPEGLYFVRVDYPPQFVLPQTAPISPVLGLVRGPPFGTRCQRHQVFTNAPNPG